MSIINMLRSGKAHGGDLGRSYTHNMYPRPDLLAEDMGQNLGWENSTDSYHLVHNWNSCECHNAGAVKRAKDADPTTDVCAIEVGDEIPLVWIPNRATLEGVTLTVNTGIQGVVLSVARYSVQAGERIIADAVQEAIHLPASSADPLAVPAVDQAAIDALGCDERLDLERFCVQCNGGGCHYEDWLTDRVIVGGCELEGQYLSLVIDTLPEEFDCSSCCLDIDVGARIRMPRCGD